MSSSCCCTLFRGRARLVLISLLYNLLLPPLDDGWRCCILPSLSLPGCFIYIYVLSSLFSYLLRALGTETLVIITSSLLAYPTPGYAHKEGSGDAHHTQGRPDNAPQPFKRLSLEEEELVQLVLCAGLHSGVSLLPTLVTPTRRGGDDALDDFFCSPF